MHSEVQLSVHNAKQNLPQTHTVFARLGRFLYIQKLLCILPKDLCMCIAHIYRLIGVAMPTFIAFFSAYATLLDNLWMLLYINNSLSSFLQSCNFGNCLSDFIIFFFFFLLPYWDPFKGVQENNASFLIPSYTLKYRVKKLI